LRSFSALHHLVDRPAEIVGLRQVGAFEMPDQAFVVVAHVDHHRTFFHLLVEGLRVEMRAHVGHVEGVIGQPISYDLLPHLDGQLQEAPAIILHGDLPRHCLEGFAAFEVGSECVEVRGWQAHLRIDAFLGEVNAAQHAQCLPFLV
jgi:hypothetical protein